MLENFFQESSECPKACRLKKCPKKKCPGKSINSDIKILPGSEYFIISINRVHYKDGKSIRLQNGIKVPLKSLRLAGYSYNLVMVMHQVAWEDKKGNEDPHDGHYYVHKRSTFNKENFWVLLDDKNIEVLEAKEMDNIIKKQSKSIVMLIYRKELSYWDDCSTSSEDSIPNIEI